MYIEFYADDAKFALPIMSVDDCDRLQVNASMFYELSTQQGLELNVSKCKVMSMSKRRSMFMYDYTFNSRSIEQTRRITDLGVVFNDRFTFKDDLTFKISRSRWMLGFLKRQAQEFSDPTALKVLYFSIIRSRMEYCSPIFNLL